MKPIGGFFELETGGAREIYHADAVALTSGRACFNLLLQQARPSKVYVPYYTCDSLLHPLELLGVPFEFYSLNRNLEPKPPREVSEDERIVYINYFGLKNETAGRLAAEYGSRMILDNSQAFFERPDPRISSFNSARKFFGVPDGAYVRGTGPSQPHLENSAIHFDHLIYRLLGRQSEAYAAYVKAEAAVTCEVFRMSALSERLLGSVDYRRAAERRRSNYSLYEEAFATANQLQLTPGDDAVPMCYPLLLKKPFPRERLFAQSIFVGTLWKEVLTRSATAYVFEKRLARDLLPLPIDHRYGDADCMRVIDAVVNLLD